MADYNSLELACNLTITCAMVYYLWQSRSGFKQSGFYSLGKNRAVNMSQRCRTDSILKRLIFYCVESGKCESHVALNHFVE
jgi:hypothetical protein